ncbi:unnamed protein product, partial [Polarella glacialis]
EGGSSSSTARAFSTASLRKESSWREQVDAFCAWCERQALSPVTVFDAPRAAALDGTFDWLLLLFAPKGLTQDQDQHGSNETGQFAAAFSWEKKRLQRFAAAACAHDRRYHEVLPVIVPWGGEDISSFRGSFGLGLQ